MSPTPLASSPSLSRVFRVSDETRPIRDRLSVERDNVTFDLEKTIYGHTVCCLVVLILHLIHVIYVGFIKGI